MVFLAFSTPAANTCHQYAGCSLVSYCIHTDRLDLIAGTIRHLDAELASASALAELLGVAIPAGWPPGEYDRPAIEFFRSRVAGDNDAFGWYVWYAVLRSNNDEPSTLVGGGGYHGPPDPAGIVEIGYSILPQFEGRGFASELVRGLVAHAFSAPDVRRMIAHTTSANIGSVKVLERNGFQRVGPAAEAGLDEWARERDR